MNNENAKNSIYWAYNLPLQAWPTNEGSYHILNYMPRHERCEMLDLRNVIEDQTPKEFFQTAAQYLENLAKRFRKIANGEVDIVYYPDEGMDAWKQNKHP